jgi:transcriptional regulator with XRE-family HTH domain
MSRRSDPDTLAVVSAFARRLCEIREESGLSQEKLARFARLHRTEVSKLERSLTDPRLSTVVSLARGLGVPTSALIEDSYERQLIIEGFAQHFGDLPAGGESSPPSSQVQLDALLGGSD